MNTRPILLGGSLLLPALAFGQVAAPIQTASALVRILAPTAATTMEDMAGDVATTVTAGEVEVKPSAGPQKKAAPGLRPASFQVTGRKGSTFALALPSDTECVLKAPDATIAVKHFQVSVAGAPPTAHPGGLTLDAEGSQAFQVGVTLVVAPGQPKRVYAGHFDVTMAYN